MASELEGIAFSAPDDTLAPEQRRHDVRNAERPFETLRLSVRFQLMFLGQFQS
jgi:hypothetical protein